MLLDVKNLSVLFPVPSGFFPAVQGISFCLREGEILGIIGGSGSGKTSAMLGLLRLVPAVVSGQVLFEGVDLLKLSEKELRKTRGRGMGVVFQDPLSALTPTRTIGSQIVESIRLHAPVSRREAWRQAKELLDLVEILDSSRRLAQYPHELSGGMRQRALIALALAPSPRLLIADEPTTALDPTIQLQLLDLLHRLSREKNMGILLITHNLGAVSRLAHRVAVMQRGIFIEEGTVEEVFLNPQHPYTQQLLCFA